MPWQAEPDVACGVVVSDGWWPGVDEVRPRGGVWVATGVQPAGWVPVERRWLGLDRRALVPALVVGLFAAFSFWVLPAIDSAVQVDDRVRAGDVIQVGDDVTFTPPAGWTLAAGLRRGASPGTAYPSQARVMKGPVAFSITTSDFKGTPQQLLKQIRSNNDKVPPSSAVRIVGQPATFTTTTGQRGVLTQFTNGESVGFIAALVFGGTGVETVALGPDTIDKTTGSQILSMFESVQPTRSARSGSGS